MIKKFLVSAVLFASLSATASAENVFIGTILTTSATGCQNSNAGDRHPSVYHPMSPGNSAFSGLSFIRDHYAVGHLLDGRAFDKTFRTVVTGGVGWGDTYTRPNTQFAQIRVLTSTPATANITNDTQTVIITGEIKRLFSDPNGLNCVVSFRGAYVKDPFE